MIKKYFLCYLFLFFRLSCQNFTEIVSNTNKLEEMLEIIAKYDYRVLVGANPEIQLSALLAELAKIGK